MRILLLFNERSVYYNYCYNDDDGEEDDDYNAFLELGRSEILDWGFSKGMKVKNEG